MAYWSKMLLSTNSVQLYTWAFPSLCNEGVFNVKMLLYSLLLTLIAESGQ